MKNAWDPDIFQSWEESVLKPQDFFGANMPKLRHSHEC